jgi:small subunit ribosomal protein S19e
MSLHDVPADKVIAKTAELFKKEKTVSPPEWAMFAKTCAGRDRAPMDPDWWYVRAASLLRRVALVGPIGTEKLRTHYGGRKNKGHQPERFYKASGNVIRTILKQLDKAGLTKQNEKGVKGRIVTANGQKVLYSLSDQIVAEKAKSQSS